MFAPCRVLSVNMAGTLEGSLGESVLCCSEIWSSSSVFALTTVTEGASRDRGSPLRSQGVCAHRRCERASFTVHAGLSSAAPAEGTRRPSSDPPT